MKQGSPKVSVVIPLFNQGKYLRDAVASVQCQTCSDWEVIIVDDSSTDSSVGTAERLVAELKGKAKLIRNTSNQGVSVSRNTACAQAAGKYIAFLDADDEWYPNKLEKQITLMEERTSDMGMVHTGVEILADRDTQQWLVESGTTVSAPRHWDEAFNGWLSGRGTRTQQEYFRKLRTSNPICMSSVLMTKSTLAKVGGFEIGLKYQVEDWLMWLECSLLFRVLAVPDRLTRYRIHSEGYTARVFIHQDYWHDLAIGQVHDRCMAFARRNGISLSYRDLCPRPRRASRLIRIAGRIKRFAIHRIRGRVSPNPSVKFTSSAGQPGSLSKGYGCDVEPHLDQLVLFVTSACNLSCKACFYSQRLNAHHDMTLANITSIARSCGRPRSVLLTGGEPFLRKDLGSVIGMFLERSFVSLNTNGSLPSAVEDVIAGVLHRQPLHPISVNVSLDGFEETHNAMRKSRDSFLKALESLRVLIALRKRYKGQMYVSVSTLISPANIGEIAELGEELAVGFELNYHNFEIERDNQDARQFFQRECHLLTRLYDRLLRLVAVRYPNAYPMDRARFGLQWRNVVTGDRWTFPCLAGMKSVVVYPDGGLSACEGRPRLCNLADVGYDISLVLRSESMSREVETIGKERCDCTHGCWLLISMMDHLARTYTEGSPEFALRHQVLLDVCRRFPGGDKMGMSIARKIERLRLLME